MIIVRSSRKKQRELGSVLTIRDALSEMAASLLARPIRSFLNVCAMAFGIASCVATLSLTETVRHQVSDDFDALRSRSLVINDLSPGEPTASFTQDDERRLHDIAGLETIGRVGVLSPQTEIRSAPSDVSGSNSSIGKVLSMTPGAFAATGTEVIGPGLNWLFETQHARVAVVGQDIARELAICSSCTDAAVFIDGIPFAVVGIANKSLRRPDALQAVIVPDSLQETLWGSVTSKTNQIAIGVQSGAALQVGNQAVALMNATEPGRYQPLAPPDPKGLRRSVDTDLEALFLGVGIVGLAAGSVAIANIVSMSILQRTGEIGLRRALGARPIHIVLHTLLDSTLIGVSGGLLGAFAGSIAVTMVSATQHWETVIDFNILALSPVVGSVLGLLAGIHPARLAARIQPARALRL